MFYFTACNVGDEGGFAPNIQDNKEGNLVIFFFLLPAIQEIMLFPIWTQLEAEIVCQCILKGGCKLIARLFIPSLNILPKIFLKWIQIRYMDRKIRYQNNDANKESGMFVLVWSFIVLLHVLTTDNFSCFVT